MSENPAGSDCLFKQRIEKYLLENKQNILEDIRRLVRFESINGRTAENRACLEFFLTRAREMGFEVKMTTTKDVGIVEMGTGGETLGILVHLDVVATGDPDKWTESPFSGAVHDGFIWGRGTNDDKGAAVMSLYAMKAVAESGIEMQQKVQLIVGTSEESYWTDIENFMREFPVPDYGYSPDGEFPIYNAENGYADIELIFKGDGGKDIHSIFAGESNNTIPSKAVVDFEDGSRTVEQGVSGHSSAPEIADNAIIKLCKKINAEKGRHYDFAMFVEDFFGEHQDGRTLKIDDGSEYVNGQRLRVTTVVPTVLRFEENTKTTSGHVSVNLNVRHKFSVTKRMLEEALERLTAQYNFRFKIKEYMDPMYVDPDLPFIRLMQEVSREYGVADDLMTAAGTTYAKAMKNFVSWGPSFLTDPQCAHMEDERLSIDSMELATKMYARFLFRTFYDKQDEDEND